MDMDIIAKCTLSCWVEWDILAKKGGCEELIRSELIRRPELIEKNSDNIKDYLETVTVRKSKLGSFYFNGNEMWRMELK